MIIAPLEVIWNSPAGRDYPLDQVCLLLDPVEEDWINECLGCDMYDWLIANVDPWPADAQEWVEGNDYDTGDYCTREGALYASLIDNNPNDPINDLNTATWEVPARFGTDACANELWENHLIKILANKIYQRTLNFTTHKSGANGLTFLDGNSSFGGQSFRSGNKAELKDYSNSLDSANEILIRNMKRWINRKLETNETCNVPLSTIPGCGTSGELCNPSLQKRRWGFKY